MTSGAGFDLQVGVKSHVGMGATRDRSRVSRRRMRLRAMRAPAVLDAPPGTERLTMSEVTCRITDPKSAPPAPGAALTQPFDELFQALSVKGSVYYAHEFASPWAVEFVESAHARFHLVLSGACHVSVGGEVFELHALDLLLLPGGQRHVVYDGKTRLTRDSHAVRAELGQAPKRATQALASVGQAPDVGLVSGHFEFDREARGLLARALPPVLRGSVRQHADNTLLAVLPEVLAQELRQSRPGAATIVARLAEVFLVQVLRAHFERVGSGNSLLSAMFEPRLNAGMRLMHACWNEPLPLARIAAAAGMSRSSFAERFKSVTGTSPMSYLAHWRLLKSRRLLADRELSIARIATLCGHRSTEGYSRAFKRAFGLSPAKWRTTNETVSHEPLVP